MKNNPKQVFEIRDLVILYGIKRISKESGIKPMTLYKRLNRAGVYLRKKIK